MRALLAAYRILSCRLHRRVCAAGATVQLLDEIRAAGKYVIFNGIRYATSKPTPTRPTIVRDDYNALQTLLPHASAGYHEPWLSGEYRNATTGHLDASRVTHGLLAFIVRTDNLCTRI